MGGKRAHLIGRRTYLKTAGLTATAVGLGTGPTAAQFEAQQDDSDDSIDVKVMVFTHFEVGKNSGDVPGEFQKWYTEYDLTTKVDVPGAWAPVFYNAETGIAGTITGMGHSICGPSVASILASPRFDFEDTYFISAGISGTPPDVGTLGSVFVSDHVLNWDYGHRWAQEDSATASYNKKKGQGQGIEDDYALQLLPFRPFDYSFELNPALVETAYNLGKNVELFDTDDAAAYRENYPEKTARRDPFVDIGTTVSGEEYWHGETFSDQAQYISDQYGASTYATTEMEDYATATAVKQHGHLDRYLSLRSVSNFDQPYPGQTVEESLAADSGGYMPSIVNVFRVGKPLVDEISSNWGDWQNGVPYARRIVA